MSGVGLKGKRVYISGPMSGLPAMNRPAFRRAAEELEALGAYPFDPANAWEHDDKPYEWCMLHDLRMLTQISDYVRGVPFFDLLVLLPGFESSQGALIELSVARACGIDCRLAEDVLGPEWGDCR